MKSRSAEVHLTDSKVNRSSVGRSGRIPEEDEDDDDDDRDDDCQAVNQRR
jgi:hypothetical protein